MMMMIMMMIMTMTIVVAVLVDVVDAAVLFIVCVFIFLRVCLRECNLNDNVLFLFSVDGVYVPQRIRRQDRFI
jgi:hypothetical protein